MKLTRAEFTGGLASALAAGSPALGQSPSPQPSGPPFETIYYETDGLRLESYLYVPATGGPFKTVIYNHGSRIGQESKQIFWRFIAKFLLPAGYAVFVPERRGYGNSQGTPYSVALANGVHAIPRLEAESTDVLAGLDTIWRRPDIDRSHVALMGWSLGGVVSLMAGATSPERFRCLVDQAGGAESWNGNASFRTVIPQRAVAATMPLYAMDAENDATTEDVRAVVRERRAHIPQFESKLTIYPPYTPTPAQQAANPTTPPGHLLFAQCDAWCNDVLEFFQHHL